MCRSHTPPSYHLLTPFNYSHVLFYFLPDHDDILGSKSSEGISDFIDALDASSDSNPERFSGWRIGPLGVRFNGQKRPLCFFPFFLFFFHEGGALGNRRVPLERLVPLSFHGGSAHVRVHATKRYHLSRVHRRIMAGFPPKATRATCTYTRRNIHSAAFVRGRRERERERKQKEGKEKREQTTAVGLNGSTTDERVRNTQSRPKGSTL